MPQPPKMLKMPVMPRSALPVAHPLAHPNRLARPAKPLKPGKPPVYGKQAKTPKTDIKTQWPKIP